jgi:hypothetical protein
MHKVTITAMTAMFLLGGTVGCDRQAGEQIEKAVDDAGEAVQNAAETARNKLEQWTDQATSDEKPQDKRPKRSPQRAAE